MDHADHEPGTMQKCPDCRALALEPGWYKAMRNERVLRQRPGHGVVPEVIDYVRLNITACRAG